MESETTKKRINQKQIIMIEWYKKVVLENYANFNGRARRAEYWWYSLGNLILFIIAAVLDSVIGLAILGPYGIFYTVLLLGTIIPSIAVGIRRMHDVGKSGWFILIPIYNLILACTEGDKGSNEYGPDPKNQYDEVNKLGTDY